MESKIGHKYPINLKININILQDQENNVDKDGITIYLLIFQRIHGQWKNRINYLDCIDRLVINGKIYQNSL
jgi:hypothetical protein